MSFVTCGFCGHPGDHATIIETPGRPIRCSGCPQCAAEIAAEQEDLLSSDDDA